VLVAHDGGFAVTDHGARKLGSLGLDVRVGDAARACLDWTEQRNHAAGGIGRALLRSLVDRGWLGQDPRTRALRLTNAGRAAIPAEVGVLPP
jgi:hypothetical protein